MAAITWKAVVKLSNGFHQEVHIQANSQSNAKAILEIWSTTDSFETIDFHNGGGSTGSLQTHDLVPVGVLIATRFLVNEALLSVAISIDSGRAMPQVLRDDVRDLLGAMDVFVMPSLSEGLGTSLLDAMAASKATVATDTGGIPEVVVDGDTGLLVPPRDHHALAHAIARLLKDQKLRDRMGAAGLARVEQMFSADRMVERTLEVYRARSASVTIR